MRSNPSENVPYRDEYAWADYLDYMEAGAELPAKPPPPVYPIWPGIAGTAILATVAYLLTAPVFGLVGAAMSEPVLVVLPLGMLLGNLLRIPDSVRPGVRYTVKHILTWGIILLGVRLHFGEVWTVGAPALLLSALQVALILALVPAVRRLFGIGEKQATLLGIGTAIGGGSAVIAAAPVIEAEERDVAFAIASVSFLGMGLMFLLPLVATAMGMPPREFGVWAGLAIPLTPQVVAAGFAYHPDAGQSATLVKLARLTLLAPLVMLISYRNHKSGAMRRRLGITDFVPLMVLGFLAFAVANSLGLLPVLDFRFPKGSLMAKLSGMAAASGAAASSGSAAASVTASLDLAAVLKAASGFAIAMGMGAVGLETSFRSLRSIGPKPLFGGVLLILAALVFSYFAVWALGLASA